LSESDGLLTPVNLSNVLIVSVKDPKPGVWKLRVRSSGQSTVRVTGLSPLDFSHFFSRALNLSDTDPRPISGKLFSTLTNQNYAIRLPSYINLVKSTFSY